MATRFPSAYLRERPEVAFGVISEAHHTAGHCARIHTFWDFVCECGTTCGLVISRGDPFNPNGHGQFSLWIGEGKRHIRKERLFSARTF